MNVLSDLPLRGKTVVLTRSQNQQGEARSLFTAKGALVLDLPALVIGPPADWLCLDQALADLDDFQWLIFSSSNGVLAVEERLCRFQKSLVHCQKTLKIAAVGRKTALSLKQIGVVADFVPPDFVADSLIKHFPKSNVPLKLLIPRVQSGGRTILAESFIAQGYEVVEVAAYESYCPKSMPENTAQVFVELGVDAIIFTSSKTVIHTVELLRRRFGESWKLKTDNLKVISIGPQTSITCQKCFQRVDQEANPHDLEGLLKACIISLQNTK